MLYIVGYKGTHSLADKARLLSACRKISSRYPQYNMIPFDTDSQLIDVILAVPPTTFKYGFFLFSLVQNNFKSFSLVVDKCEHFYKRGGGGEERVKAVSYF